MPEPALTIYYDGRCRICQDQRRRFDRLDAGRGVIRQVDFNDPEFDPDLLGVPMDQIRSGLHARTEQGEVLAGMAAVRAAYRAIGKGWLTAPTGWPLLRPVFDALYRKLARHRYRLGGTCEDGTCRIDH